MSPAIREALPKAVHTWLDARVKEIGARPLAPGVDLFEQGLLDSVALAALVAHVETRTGCEIDFLEVDPEALSTVDGMVGELLKAARAR